jgi:hypothetical protein
MYTSFILPFKLLLTDRSISFDIIFFSILLILIPIVLITGPALPDIFLSLIAMYFLVISILKKKWEYYKNPIVVGFIIFCIYGILRSLFSDMPVASLTNEGSAFYFRYIFFSMGIWYLLDHNPYLPKCFIFISVICLAFVCLDGLYQYFVGINIIGNHKIGINRLTSFFGKEPILGRYISYLSIFTFALIYQNFQKTKKMLLLSVVFLVMCEVVVFLSGERAPFFYISFFTVLLVIFIPKFRIYRIVGIVISMFIILGILLINPNAKERMVNQTIEEISETKLSVLPYSTAHEEHYISSLKMFYEYPLFGIGTNTFRYQSQKHQYRSEKNDINSHPHHYYIQVLAELGIVGFGFLVSFYLYISLIGFKQLLFILLPNNKSKQIPFEFLLYPMILFVYWWPIIPHMSFYNNWNNVLMMLPLGFFMKYFHGNINNGHFHKI